MTINTGKQEVHSQLTVQPVQEGAPWAFIAVMGVTGAGKSSFIRTVSGDDSVVVGDGLESCTSELQGYSFHHDGYNINLVDSPGFNDTFKTETQVLRDISAWLKSSYEMQNRLSGIVYLHGILHPRLEGSALRNLKMFRELCGADPLKNVVLATTFWGEVKPAIGERREQELASTDAFWGGMLKRGSRLARFTDRQSGLDILSSLLKSEPKALKIQREMVEDDMSLIDTGAGQIVNEELAKMEQEHRQKQVEMQRDMEEAIKQHDEEMQEILAEDRKRLEAEIDRVHRQQEELKADRRASDRKMQNQLDSAKHDFRAREEELQELVSQLQGDEKRRQRERSRQDEKNEVARKEWQSMTDDLTSQLRRQRRERKEQDARLQQLERYNELALKQWESLDLDGMIAKVRAQEAKLRAEDRERLEAEIAKLKKSKMSKGSKSKILLKVFSGALQVAVPLASFFTLGIPIPMPNIAQLLLGTNADEQDDVDAGAGADADADADAGQ